MTQALQLLAIVGVGIALAGYGLLKDRKEHPPKTDPRQENLFKENDHDRLVVAR